MPSQRRIKVFAILAGILLLVILYTNHSARQSDRDFYDKTVQALNDRKSANKPAEAEAKLNAQSLNQKQDSHAAEKSRLQGVEEEESIKNAEIKPKPKADAAPAAKSGVPHSPGTNKKWDAGDEPVKPAKDDRTDEEKDVELELNTILKRSPIIIFSKSYCPFSKKAKAVFAKYDITPAPFIVELDEHKMGSKLQDHLQKLTGRRTVPNILVSGSSIGGGDDVGLLHENGELIDKIKSLGGKRIMEIGLKKA